MTTSTYLEHWYREQTDAYPDAEEIAAYQEAWRAKKEAQEKNALLGIFEEEEEEGEF
jgi:hypothetical protein